MGYARAGSSPAFGTILIHNFINKYRELGLTTDSLSFIWATFGALFSPSLSDFSLFSEVKLKKEGGQSLVNVTSWSNVIHVNDIIGLVIPKYNPEIPGTYSVISCPIADHVFHVGLV